MVLNSLGFPLCAAPACGSARYSLALLSCFGFFVVYSLRVNLSVAMVDMVNTTHQSSANHSSSVCPAHPSPARPKHNHTVSRPTMQSQLSKWALVKILRVLN